MGKNKDLIQILIIVLIGMFFPFLGSLIISFGLNVFYLNDLLTIGQTFGYFILIFAIELAIVYLYFTISNWIASKKIEKYKSK
jgi:hypothetical protein